MKRICLVACVSMKRARPTEAKDLYVSPWFVKARRYAESICRNWWILSAEYGLLHPERIVPPYEKTLTTMRLIQRRAWAAQVRAQMERNLPNADEIVVLAGEKYREFLMPYLRARFAEVVVPMRGLGIGHQLQFLTEALEDLP